MIYIAFFLLIVSSFEIGLMSAIRKVYQVKNGIGKVSTEMFMMLAMAVMFVFGICMAGGIECDGIIIGLSLLYAFVSAATAILCLIGSAFGNISIIIICASLGTLIIPSLYGILIFPEENKLTLLKIIGYISAFIILIMNFFAERKSGIKQKNSLKYKLTCLTVFFTQGSALVLLSIVNKHGVNNFTFMTLYSGFSVVMMAVLIFAEILKSKDDTVRELKSAGTIKNFALIAGYSVFAFTSELIALYCVGKVPMVFQAPISFSVPIISIAIIDYILYKVKLTKRQLIQIALAIICCVMFLLG